MGELNRSSVYWSQFGGFFFTPSCLSSWTSSLYFLYESVALSPFDPSTIFPGVLENVSQILDPRPLIRKKNIKTTTTFIGYTSVYDEFTNKL